MSTLHNFYHLIDLDGVELLVFRQGDCVDETGRLGGAGKADIRVQQTLVRVRAGQFSERN